MNPDFMPGGYFDPADEDSLDLEALAESLEAQGDALFEMMEAD